MSVLGFSVNSPMDSIEHYSYGEPNWLVHVVPFGQGGARYANVHAHARFGNLDNHASIPAEDYTDHLGDIAVFARLHLALAGKLDRGRFTLDSAQVEHLIGVK